MTFKPKPQSQYARERKVWIKQMTVTETRVEITKLFAGSTRAEQQGYQRRLNNIKGSLRNDKAKVISIVTLVLVPDLPEGAYTVYMIGTGIGSANPIFTMGEKTDPPTRFDAGLRRLGLKRDFVDYVILPDLTFANASNIIYQDTRGERGPACPNANYILHQYERDTVMAGLSAHAEAYHDVRWQLKELEIMSDKTGKTNRSDKFDCKLTVWDGDELKLNEYVRMHRHGGATPGFNTVYIRVNSSVIVCSPLFFPTLDHVNPATQTSWTFHGTETYQAKEEVLDECRANRYIIAVSMEEGIAGYPRKNRDGTWELERVNDVFV